MVQNIIYINLLHETSKTIFDDNFCLRVLRSFQCWGWRFFDDNFWLRWVWTLKVVAIDFSSLCASFELFSMNFQQEFPNKFFFFLWVMRYRPTLYGGGNLDLGEERKQPNFEKQRLGGGKRKSQFWEFFKNAAIFEKKLDLGREKKPILKNLDFAIIGMGICFWSVSK